MTLTSADTASVGRSRVPLLEAARREARGRSHASPTPQYNFRHTAPPHASLFWSGSDTPSLLGAPRYDDRRCGPTASMRLSLSREEKSLRCRTSTYVPAERDKKPRFVSLWQESAVLRLLLALEDRSEDLFAAPLRQPQIDVGAHCRLWRASCSGRLKDSPACLRQRRAP